MEKIFLSELTSQTQTDWSLLFWRGHAAVQMEETKQHTVKFPAVSETFPLVQKCHGETVWNYPNIVNNKGLVFSDKHLK